MKAVIISFVILAASAIAAAQSPSKILKNAERALGGSRAIAAANSWQMSGTVSSPSVGRSGRFSAQAARPYLYNLQYDLSGFETEYGFNGRSGWTRDSRDGLKTLTGDESVAFQAEAGFRNALWTNYKRERSRLAAGGRGTIDGKPTASVVIGTAKGVNFTLHFDAATWLLLREEIEIGSKTKRIDYADYRPVSGVKRPFLIKVSEDETLLEFTVDNATVNGPVDRAAFDFPVASNEPLPDITALLKQVQENEDRVEKILDTYSFIQQTTRREFGKDGALRDTGSETFQLSFYKGNRIRRLIEKNGRPLSEKDQADEDKEVAKQVEEIEERLANQEATAGDGPPREDGPRVSIAEVFRASRLINPRRERFRGRDVIVFDFEPNPDFDYKNAKSFLKFFGKTAGVMWIDEQDKQVARLEAYLADSFNVAGGLLAKLRKGASFTLEQERVNDEIWLPSSADINLSVRVLLVKGVNINQVIRSYDYRKFATEVRGAEVDEVKQ